MAVQGPVIAWVADHRKHHAHTDDEGDPHSPHVGHGDGVGGVLRGPLARAHGLAALRAGPRRLEALRPRPLRGPRHAADQPALLSCWCCSASRSRPLAGCAAHRHAARRRHRPALGRPGAHLLRAPRHLERQLGLPLPRHPAASRSTTSRPTSSGWRCPRSASPGTTTTTPSRARPSTACAAGSSTPPRC